MSVGELWDREDPIWMLSKWSLSAGPQKSSLVLGAQLRVFLGLCRKMYLFILLGVLQCRPRGQSDVPKAKQEVWCQNQGTLITGFTASSFSFSFPSSFFSPCLYLPFLLSPSPPSLWLHSFSFSLTPHHSLPFPPSPSPLLNYVPSSQHRLLVTAWIDLFPGWSVPVSSSKGAS